MEREPYPLFLGLAFALLTNLGLAAVALGVQWGAAPPSDLALDSAWLYINVLWTLGWILLWPAAALRPGGAPIPLRWQWAAILVGAFPSFGIAAFLSGVTFPRIIVMLALQLTFGLLIAAILRLHSRFPRSAQALLALVATLTLAGPIAAFLWFELFSLASRGWFHALPLFVVRQAAQTPHAVTAPQSFLWMAVALYAAVACLLLLAARVGRAQKKAPGTQVPRA
jgi:hypothetical protein